MKTKAEVKVISKPTLPLKLKAIPEAIVPNKKKVNGKGSEKVKAPEKATEKKATRSKIEITHPEKKGVTGRGKETSRREERK